MTLEERIQLRDELIYEFEQLKLITLSKKGVYVFNRNHPYNEVLKSKIELQTKFYQYVQEFRSESEALKCLKCRDDITNHICPVCEINYCKFDTLNNRYRKTCSTKCSESLSNSPEANAKKEQTCLKHFNVTHHSKSELIKQKKRDTVYAHYNVGCTFQAQEVIDQIKYTKFIRYNNENYTNREKAIQTYLDRYKVNNPFQAIEFQAKSIETIRRLYGVDNISQLHINNLDIYSDNNRFKNFIINRYKQKGMFLTLKEICSYFNISPLCLKHKLESLDLLNYFYIQDSQLEIDFKTFLESYNIQFQRRNRSILIKDNIRRELDFLINNSIGIEINDIASHNSFENENKTNWFKDPLYHQYKSLLAIEKGIRLIHIWEWELRNESLWSKISQWLLNNFIQFNYSINLEDCQLVYINKDIEHKFYSLYSLIEYQDSDICLGLIKDNVLYQIMSFKNMNNQWYLINHGTAYNYYIDNGYQTILNSFKSSYKLQTIIYISDISKDDITLYDQLGFKLIDILEPSIIWCNKDMNLSDIEQEGYIPIYNCGYNVYTMTIK